MTKRMIALFIAVCTMMTVCTAFAAGWTQDEEGNFSYIDNFGTLSVGFTEIEGRTYYFDQEGKLVYGWFEIRMEDIGFGDDEDLVGWHFANPDGELVRGFARINGQIYYFDDNGTMVTGRIMLDNIIFAFDESGVLTNGNVQNILMPEYVVTKEGSIVVLSNGYIPSPTSSPKPY